LKIKTSRMNELLYYLMDKEKVQWKTIKEDFRKRGWGPTTLKNYLDQLIQQDIIYLEYRKGKRGPEAWYCISIQKHAEKLFQLQKKLVITETEIFSVKELKELSENLRAKIFPVMLSLFEAQYINYFYLTALTKYRNRKCKNIDSLLQAASQYFYDVGFKRNFQKLLEFTLAFPKETQIAIAEMLNRPELKAWVKGEEFEVNQWTKQVISEANKKPKQLMPEIINYLKQRLEKTKSKDKRLILKKIIQKLEGVGNYE